MRSFVEYSKVPDKYRLSFVVGEIVRNDVWAENETKVLFNRLRAGGLPSDPMLRDFGKVIPQVRRTLMLPGYVIRIRLNLSVLASMCCSLLKPARVAFRKNASSGTKRCTGAGIAMQLSTRRSDFSPLFAGQNTDDRSCARGATEQLIPLSPPRACARRLSGPSAPSRGEQSAGAGDPALGGGEGDAADLSHCHRGVRVAPLKSLQC